MRYFSPKDPSEVRAIGFDFLNDISFLASGAMLTGLPTFTIEVAPGYTDPNVSSMFVGSPQLIGTITLQMCQGGISGNTYIITSSCGTNTGEVIIEGGILNIVPAWTQ